MIFNDRLVMVWGNVNLILQGFPFFSNHSTRLMIPSSRYIKMSNISIIFEKICSLFILLYFFILICLFVLILILILISLLILLMIFKFFFCCWLIFVAFWPIPNYWTQILHEDNNSENEDCYFVSLSWARTDYLLMGGGVCGVDDSRKKLRVELNNVLSILVFYF